MTKGTKNDYPYKTTRTAYRTTQTATDNHKTKTTTQYLPNRRKNQKLSAFGGRRRDGGTYTDLVGTNQTSLWEGTKACGLNFSRLSKSCDFRGSNGGKRWGGELLLERKN